ncbi:MAG: T9SS type A sorting domain-containing protein, partial [Rhodothermales bacterium]
YDGDYGLLELPVTVAADGVYTLSLLQENDGSAPDPDFINFFIDDVSLTPSTGAISIAEARAAGVGETVTIEGIVTRAKGAFAYIQDETAGLAIRQPSGAFFDDVAAGTITEGTELLITGTLSEFRGLLQINEADLASYEILGQGDAPDPQDITLDELINNGEEYESELVMVAGLSTDATGTFAAATSYDVSDSTTPLSDNNILRVPNAADSDIDGTDIPADQFIFTGVVGQFDATAPEDEGYQLLAIEESDIEAGPPPVDEAIHDTGLVQFEVYDDGNLGTVSPAPFAGQGFVFDGVNASGNGGLFAATFLVGQSPDQVSGTAYESGDWVTTSPLFVADPPEDFDQAFETSYDDSGAPLPIGLEIEQFSYSSTEAGRDGFVIIEFDVENTTEGDLEDLYVGIFADWDAGSAIANLGDYDEETSTLYVFDDEFGGDSNYYGVTALDDNVSGYNLDAGGGANPTDEDVYNSMTTFFPIPQLVGDRRTVIGVGPYDIAAGDTETVRFAFVGGEDLDGLIANARVAQGGGVDVEASTPDGTFVLESAYPNPFASATTIGFTLPSAQDVTLTVYDVLGRRVATLVDGVRQAGEQTVRFDASSLPSGMYFYRLEAGGTQLTQRVTVIR